MIISSNNTNTLVFWKEPIPEFLANSFWPENIHLGLGEFSENDWDKNYYKGIIILCELNRNEKGEQVKMQELYGIKLAQELRRKGVNAPIVFTSFLSRKQVYASKLERGIINTIGHAFVQLPCTPVDWVKAIEELKPLNELEMYDIVHNYCSLAGTIRVLMHVLHSYTGTDFRQKIRDAISQAHHLFGQDAASALLEFDQKFPTLDQENKRAATDFAEEVGNVLIEKFTSSEESASALRAEGKWKLLLLDDEIGPEHQFVKELQSRDVDVLCTRTADAARKVIDDDYHDEKRILVIVSDYRLNEEKNGLTIQQPVQGYRFIKEVSEEKPYMRFVALSALPRKFLMHSFKHYGIRPGIFAKKDYFENSATLNLLCDELAAIGNENAEAITRLPRITSKGWKLFEPFYLAHRNSDDCPQNEHFISQKAKEYCEGIIEGEYRFKLEGYTVALGRIDEKSQKITFKDTNKEKYRKEFINKLICRRVAIWYAHHEAPTLQEVHKIIKGRTYKGNESSTSAKNQINTNLALSLTEFPWNMTLEERYWMTHVMGISGIEEIEKHESQILEAIDKRLSTWLREKKLDSQLRKSPEFKRFYIENRRIYASNFTILKLFLYRLHLYLTGDDSTIQSMLNQITEWEKILPKSTLSRNVEKYKSYSKDLRKRLRLIKSITPDTKITFKTYEEYFDVIASEAMKRVQKSVHSDFRTNALIFYNEVTTNDRSFNSRKEWVNALLAYHKKEMRKLEAHGFEFDEVKLHRRKKSFGDDENE